MMKMETVLSSGISHIGHDPNTNVLHVKFSNGHTYAYADVSAEKHQALVGAKSIGKHFREHFLKADAHACTRIS